MVDVDSDRQFPVSVWRQEEGNYTHCLPGRRRSGEGWRGYYFYSSHKEEGAFTHCVPVVWLLVDLVVWCLLLLCPAAGTDLVRQEQLGCCITLPSCPPSPLSLPPT